MIKEGLFGLNGLTSRGKKLATKIMKDENRWIAAREFYPDKDITRDYGTKFIEEVLTKGELVKLDKYINTRNDNGYTSAY